MSALGPILGMAAGLYAVRLAGFVLSRAAVPPAWERAGEFVPVAMLTALVVSGLVGRADGGIARFGAALGAALVVRRTGRLWMCIASGMALYWLLRLV